MEIKLGKIEAQFADIIWNNEPISSSLLAKKAEEVLNWKKSTSYTILKRLCDRGLFCNNKGIVSSLISKEEFYSMQSEQFVEDTFAGSLPAFVTAFSKRQKLSKEEIERIKKIIDTMEE